MTAAQLTNLTRIVEDSDFIQMLDASRPAIEGQTLEVKAMSASVASAGPKEMSSGRAAPAAA